ncbi:hypothetical protein [Mycobacterium sp. 852002-51057_SCH5723018]|uniref:hypothetical protein n=1 Tax=Mycobacterium sp. 852002-51057_SCH5723018 TaxID=1834094 RepID=UPI000AC51A2E|nr:hypothetical protein [Mycobacterium sp. 852002-51057_SCH5723018]
MTQGTSPPPNGPEEEPDKASPDNSTKDAGPPRPSTREQEAAKSRSRRSNEFWLALAGIFATVVVGVTASSLAYRASGNQIKAETDRVAVQFSKEQRKSAYADFLTAYTDLSEVEFEFTHQLARTDDFEMSAVVDKSAAYATQSGKCRSASATVELIGSAAVDKARGELVDKHNDIQNLIQPLALAIAKAGNPRSYGGKVSELQRVVEKVQRDDDRLRQAFIEAAKRDLGFVD